MEIGCLFNISVVLVIIQWTSLFGQKRLTSFVVVVFQTKKRFLEPDLFDNQGKKRNKTKSVDHQNKM